MRGCASDLHDAPPARGHAFFHVEEHWDSEELQLMLIVLRHFPGRSQYSVQKPEEEREQGGKQENSGDKPDADAVQTGDFHGCQKRCGRAGIIPETVPIVIALLSSLLSFSKSPSNNPIEANTACWARFTFANTSPILNMLDGLS